ncbi:hypothetical protein ElyMa_004420300 [Elysia marginata]|uniref:Uncharacterized protein n=1 Tax=Elysia marginata TaxID=1093978 RepID=A0AAV4HEE1_9GAST|nr:hypothetical protein ElyMa_004420300 [Elysia marginata]
MLSFQDSNAGPFCAGDKCPPIDKDATERDLQGVPEKSVLGLNKAASIVPMDIIKFEPCSCTVCLPILSHFTRALNEYPATGREMDRILKGHCLHVEAVILTSHVKGQLVCSVPTTSCSAKFLCVKTI